MIKVDQRCLLLWMARQQLRTLLGFRFPLRLRHVTPTRTKSLCASIQRRAQPCRFPEPQDGLSSGVALPTLSPAADYFLGVDLGSAGPIFDIYGSDPSRAPSAGDPVSIGPPTISAVVPEPATCSLLGGAFLAIAIMKRLSMLITPRRSPSVLES